MSKKGKTKVLTKIFSLLLAVCMSIAFSITSFAATETTERPILPKAHNNYSLRASHIGDLKSTKAWPGSGPAAQVSDVRIVDHGYLDNFPGHEGHFGVIVKVMGHGRDYATYDGNTVKLFKHDPIILTGTLVDGWYNYYDLGIPTTGSHKFEVLMRSLNWPYTEKSAWATFTFTPKEN